MSALAVELNEMANRLQEIVAVLNGRRRVRRTSPPIDLIIDVTAKHFNTKRRFILSDRRHVPLVRVRQIAMYLCKDMTTRSYPIIGRMFRRDHSTIVAGVKKIEGILFSGRDSELERTITELKAKIRSAHDAALPASSEPALAHPPSPTPASAGSPIPDVCA